MKRKWIMVLVGLLVAAVVLLGGGFWYMSTQPLYAPGMVRREQGLSAPLAPPPQVDGSATWRVEPGIELAHFAAGEGRTVIVVHGGPGIPFTAPLHALDPLTTAYRFHYYDQRGSGESTRPFDRFEGGNPYNNMQALDRALGLGAQVADIERIRRLLGEDKLILLGHSWGGLLASLYAAEFPEHVDGLILVSPANMLVMPQPEEESDLFASVRDRLPAERQAEFASFMDEYMDFASLFEKSEDELVALNERFGEFYAAVVDLPAVEQGRPGGWMVWAQYISMGQRHDYRKALAAVEAPVLVLHGLDDLQSEQASRMYAEAFPHATFETIADAGHFSFEEQPRAFAGLVQAFLDDLD